MLQVRSGRVGERRERIGQGADGGRGNIFANQTEVEEWQKSRLDILRLMNQKTAAKTKAMPAKGTRIEPKAKPNRSRGHEVKSGCDVDDAEAKNDTAIPAIRSNSTSNQADRYDRRSCRRLRQSWGSTIGIRGRILLWEEGGRNQKPGDGLHEAQDARQHRTDQARRDSHSKRPLMRCALRSYRPRGVDSSTQGSRVCYRKLDGQLVRTLLFPRRRPDRRNAATGHASVCSWAVTQARPSFAPTRRASAAPSAPHAPMVE